MIRSVRKSRVTFRTTNILTRSCKGSEPKPEDTRLRFRIWVDVWSYYKKRATVVNILLGSLAVGGTGYYLYKSKSSPDSLLPSMTPPEDIILNAFKVGKGFDSFQAEDDLADVKRAKLEEEILKILLPERSKHYVVVVGENGCGKSTIVRKVLSSFPEPKGVVYFDCPFNPKEFSTKFLKLLEYKPSLKVSEGARRYIENTTKEEKDPDVRSEPLSSFSLLGDDLFAAAAAFKSEHKRPMVLVLDSVDRLAKGTPEFLAYLQDFAKDCADRGNLRVVFITSDGSALPLLMSRSAWSRVEKPPFEVGEISDVDAISYLKKRGITPDLAEKVVKEITGGLFVMLNDFVSNHQKGIKYEEIQQILNAKTNIDMIDLQISENHILFKRLIANAKVRIDEARALGMPHEKLELLLKKNILAIHPDLTYTFHDRHVSRWFNERIEKV